MGGVEEERKVIKTIIDYQNYLREVYGFDWNDTPGVIKKLKEEIDELEEAIKTKDNEKIKEEFGDVLITIVNLSRFLNLPILETLKESFKKFKKRIKLMEEIAKREGINLRNLSIDELDRIWEEIKEEI